MNTDYTQHYSVMYQDCLDAFKGVAKKKQGNCHFADMTFGGGGHSLGIAREIQNSVVFSVDQDPDAFKNGLQKIQQQGLSERVKLNKMNFEEFPRWVTREHKDLRFDGILMDLGVSSHHFDQFDRGFSFREDAFLDMRMDSGNDSIATAAEVLSLLNEEEIANVIYKYGEERYSRKIAKAISEFKKREKLERTKQLEDIVFHSYPKHLRHKKIHPATKTFQALRIYVNRELEVLEDTLQDMYELLSEGGILAVISFHSLEDRIVKHKFKEIFQTHINTARILTKKPLYPSEQEVVENSRSRSAKLRILEKLDQDAQGGVDGKKGKKKKAQYNT